MSVLDLLRRGATVLSEHDGWRTLADPEGNDVVIVGEA